MHIYIYSKTTRHFSLVGGIFQSCPCLGKLAKILVSTRVEVILRLCQRTNNRRDLSVFVSGRFTAFFMMVVDTAKTVKSVAREYDDQRIFHR